MADLSGVLNHVSTSTKAAWILWLVWSVVQVGWYRRFVVAVPAPQPQRGPRIEQRHPGPKVRRPENVTTTSESRSAPAEPDQRLGGTFISLDLDERRSASVDQPSADRNVGSQPVFLDWFVQTPGTGPMDVK